MISSYPRNNHPSYRCDCILNRKVSVVWSCWAKVTNKPKQSRTLKEIFQIIQGIACPNISLINIITIYNSIQYSRDPSSQPLYKKNLPSMTNLIISIFSREERRRIWKGVFRVKSEMRKLRGQCDSINRNLSQVIGKVGRQAQELSRYVC